MRNALHQEIAFPLSFRFSSNRVHILFNVPSRLTVHMLTRCSSLTISTVRFKGQLSFPSALFQIIENDRDHDRYYLFNSFFNSVAIPNSAHSYSKDTHSHISFCSDALKLSAKLGSLHRGKQLHAYMIKHGLCDNLFCQNQILHVYVKCKEIDDTVKLFDEMRVRNVVTWNTVICGIVGCCYSFKPSVYLGFSYFRRMLLENVGLDFITVNGLLRGCKELDCGNLGRQLHSFIVKLGFDLDCFVSSALVDLYGKYGLIEDARLVFDKIIYRDLVLWNIMVSCYALNCLVNEAFKVFNLMRLEDMKGDGFTFSSLLNSCGKTTFGSLELGKQIHGLVIKQCFDLDVLVASTLVDMYAKNQDIADARRVFDGMTVKNVVTWNTMVVGYGRCGDGKEAMRLLKEMFRRNINPDELTVASVLSSCGDLSNIYGSMQVHVYVVKNGLGEFLSIGNALIGAYSKCGSISDAFSFFSSVREPDLVTWTSIIGSYAFHGNSEESIEIFEKMLSRGVRPDRIAFLEVISACSHGGLVNEGLHYFNLMTNDYKIAPSSAHYTSLIDLLGRAGLLNEAYNVLALIPSTEPRSDAFGAFLGTCKVHGCVGLAKWAEEKLFELEPGKSVNYSLVSDMYASEGSWFDVQRVRGMMRGNCKYKVPGSSWVEIAGEIHSVSIN